MLEFILKGEEKGVYLGRHDILTLMCATQIAASFELGHMFGSPIVKLVSLTWSEFKAVQSFSLLSMLSNCDYWLFREDGLFRFYETKYVILYDHNLP